MRKPIYLVHEKLKKFYMKFQSVSLNEFKLFLVFKELCKQINSYN